MAQLKRPVLRVGGISSKVYVVTHGKVTSSGEKTYLDATRKYDVTNDFEDVAKELGWNPPAE